MEKQKLITQGAEAKILLSKGIRRDPNLKEGLIKGNLVPFITKDRISKSYRIKELDNKIRKSRTKKETKLMIKASKIINVPLPSSSKDNTKLIIPFIDGKKLSENLDLFPLAKQKSICKLIGQDIAKLHDSNIIHGDLTTSNMILFKTKIYFIDFGLGFISHKLEDKAVDLHLLKQALEAKHYKHWEALWKQVEFGYKTSKQSRNVLERLRAVEKRGRYKKH